MTPLMIGGFVTYATYVPLCHVRARRSISNEFSSTGMEATLSNHCRTLRVERLFTLSLSFEEIIKERKSRGRRGSEIRSRRGFAGKRESELERLKGGKEGRTRKERKEGRKKLHSLHPSVFLSPLLPQG